MDGMAFLGRELEIIRGTQTRRCPTCNAMEKPGYRRCQGKNVIVDKCHHVVFVVSSADEVEELVVDLETMPQSPEDYRAIFHFLDLIDNTIYFFDAFSEEFFDSDGLDERLRRFEQLLPPRCSYCKGQGFSSSTSTTCPKCNGLGTRQS
jgi:hypothetical protein